MNVTDVKDNGKKLSPELLELKEEMKTDMEMLITLPKASIDALLQIKQAWEEGIKECRTLQQLNVKLSTRIEKVEGDNKQLQDRVRHLEDKLLEGNVIIQGITDTLWEPSESTKERSCQPFHTQLVVTPMKIRWNRLVGFP